MQDKTSPSTFQNPPVVETVFRMQFDPLNQFSNAHLGAFWKSLGSDWPHVNDAPPLEQQQEQFGEERALVNLGSLRLRFSSNSESRLQITNAAKNRMIQLQNGSLLYNWRSIPSERYATYAVLKPEFDGIRKRFEDFCRNERLEPPHSNQWEITYVNHIIRGTIWDTAADWAELFPGLGGSARRLDDLSPDGLFGEWNYVIPPQYGRLHIRLEHGWKQPTGGEEMLVLTLTARGPIDGKETAFEAGVQRGHTVIVNTFQRLASNKARQYWLEVT